MGEALPFPFSTLEVPRLLPPDQRPGDSPRPESDAPPRSHDQIKLIDIPKAVPSPAMGMLESKHAETERRLPANAVAPDLHRPDPLVQSLLLLVTMAAMLLAARFAVPQIVEEIRYAWHRGELRAEYETGTDGLKNVSLDALSDAYEMVTAAVGPTVVHIDVERKRLSPRTELNTLSQSSPLSDQGSGLSLIKRVSF